MKEHAAQLLKIPALVYIIIGLFYGLHTTESYTAATFFFVLLSFSNQNKCLLGF